MSDAFTRASQASGLLQFPRRSPVKVVAVTGGKGGVGKTTATANLGIALARRGRQVMILDADLGLANVDVVLGLQPRFNLGHVLEGRCTLEQAIVTGPAGVQVVPAASGIARMAALSPAEHAGIIHAFSEVGRGVEVLLIDTAAGIGESVLTFSRAAHQVLVVVCDEPASITDAYALIKVLSRDQGVSRFQVLASQSASAGEGRVLYEKLARVCDRFLDVILEYAGAVPDDPFLRRAVQRQQPVVEAFPASPSALAFKNLAERADKWTVPAGARGHLEFFLERLVGAGTGVVGVVQ